MAPPPGATRQPAYGWEGLSSNTEMQPSSLPPQAFDLLPPASQAPGGLFQFPQPPILPSQNTDIGAYDQSIAVPDQFSEDIYAGSGRSRRRTDTPFSTSQSRVSKSPLPRSRKTKRTTRKNKKADIDNTNGLGPAVTAPLSVATKDLDIPMRDIEKYVNRSLEERRREAEEKGRIKRPMNCFMLYRSANSARAMAWSSQNNHQVVSSVSGASWHQEPKEIQEKFKEWSRIESENHHAAFPEWKFKPDNSGSKRKRTGQSDEEEELEDSENELDGEYRQPTRRARHRRQSPLREEVQQGVASMGLTTQPYYDARTAVIESYPYGQNQSLHAQSPFESVGTPFSQDRNTFYGQPIQPRHGYGSVPPPNMQDTRTSTPVSQTLGQYGMPTMAEGVFDNSRGSTPMQPFPRLEHGAYAQYPESSGFAVQSDYPHPRQNSRPRSVPQVFGPGQFLGQPTHHHHPHHPQQPQQPQQQSAIDPALNFDPFTREFAIDPHQSHFDDTHGGLRSDQLPNTPLYFNEEANQGQDIFSQWPASREWS